MALFKSRAELVEGFLGRGFEFINRKKEVISLTPSHIAARKPGDEVSKTLSRSV